MWSPPPDSARHKDVKMLVLLLTPWLFFPSFLFLHSLSCFPSFLLSVASAGFKSDSYFSLPCAVEGVQSPHLAMLLTFSHLFSVIA